MSAFHRIVQQVSATIAAQGRPITSEDAPAIVRAMLAAIHEPDTLMIEAGFEVVRAAQESESDIAFRDDAAQIWRSMMDALISQAR